MRYLYLYGKTYLFKRRIPHSQKFYTFNTSTRNAKKAFRISLLFNKLSYNLFEYIKLQGKHMTLDFQEAYTILDEYKRKALNEENNDLEKSRHIHLGKLTEFEKKINEEGIEYYQALREVSEELKHSRESMSCFYLSKA